MVKNNSREGMIDPVVDVVTRFAFTPGFADDFGDGGGGGRDDEAAWLGQDLDVFGEQPVNLRIDLSRQRSNRFDMRIVGRREAATDVDNLDFVPAIFRLLHNGGR